MESSLLKLSAARNAQEDRELWPLMTDAPTPPSVPFDEVDWHPMAPGAREKVQVVEGTRLRLLELTEGFEEEGWCRKSHWGLVLEGAMRLELPSGSTRLREGEAIALPPDDEHRHKASVPAGGRAVLFLVEPVEGAG